jgi:KaiC/GvpD/RAD55 family RecA-like ATPase
VGRNIVVNRLTTGLAGLDAQLGGGVPPGTVHILIAEPMNAQELFTYHFAGSDGPCLFLTTEVDPDEVEGGLQRVAAGNDAVTINTLKPAASGALPAAPKDGRFVLDTFGGYCETVGWEKAWAGLQKLKGQVRESGQTALISIISGITPEDQIARLKLWADGVVELGFDRQGFGIYPYLKVTKLRGVPDSARFLLFKETEKGLFMESTRRVF